MKAPFTLEDSLWKSCVSGNLNSIEEYISCNTIFIVNEKRFVGAEIMDFLSGIHFRNYTINHMEVVFDERGVVQTVYDTKTTVNDMDERTYYVSTTWLKSDNENDASPKCLRLMSVIRQ